jgi:hypothetical protein
MSPQGGLLQNTTRARGCPIPGRFRNPLARGQRTSNRAAVAIRGRLLGCVLKLEVSKLW